MYFELIQIHCHFLLSGLKLKLDITFQFYYFKNYSFFLKKNFLDSLISL